MADWYISSAVYTGLTAFQISHVYSVGDIIKPITTTFTTRWVFRCTTAGTSAGAEPSWNAANNGTTTSGGAVFTNITGQSSFGWTAPAGTLASLTQSTNNRTAGGDRVFLSSDHSESNSAATSWLFNNSTNAFSAIQIVSVNRAGSTPPVAADITNGASLATTSGNIILDAFCNLFWQGVTISSAADIRLNSTGTKQQYLKDCTLVISGATASSRIGSVSSAKIILDNTTAQFGATGQGFGPLSTGPNDLTWVNTPSAIQGGTIPTTLFNDGTTSAVMLVTCRGVDLSAIVGTLFGVTSGWGLRGLLDSCKIAAAVTRLSAPAITSAAADEVELVNCYDGVSIINERHTYAGAVTVDYSMSMSSGAVDDNGSYSLKLVSGTRNDKFAFPFPSFWLDVENTLVGSSKTATVEIKSTASLNDDDISLFLEYMGTAGSPVASFGNSLTTVLSAGSALTSSSVTWTDGYTYWNPADANTITFNYNNLGVVGGIGANGVRAINGVSTGKQYFESTMTWAGGATSIGIGLASANLSTPTTGTAYVSKSAGNIIINNVASGSSLGARASGDVIGIATDYDADLIWFRVCPSGNWNGSGAANPATGTGGLSISAISTGDLFPLFNSQSGGDAAVANFGATTFNGTIPSGFSAGPVFGAGVKQKLTVTFTPQEEGRVRGLVRLGKTSATVWANPQIAIT